MEELLASCTIHDNFPKDHKEDVLKAIYKLLHDKILMQWIFNIFGGNVEVESLKGWNVKSDSE